MQLMRRRWLCAGVFAGVVQKEVLRPLAQIGVILVFTSGGGGVWALSSLLKADCSIYPIILS